MPWRPGSSSVPRQRAPDTRPGSTARGYGYGWQQARARFLRRYPDCALCGNPATEAHHIVARRHGGSDDESNLLPACKPCHSRLTGRGQ